MPSTLLAVLSGALAMRSILAVTQMPDPCPAGSSATGPAPDHSAWTTILRDVVVQNGSIGGVTTALIDYEKLRVEPGRTRLQQYILSLCSVDVAALGTFDKLAFWANAYNAVMCSIIAHYRPGVSVKELHSVVPGGSIWDAQLATVAGEKVSLGVIEHHKIRGSLAKAGGVSGRIHAAMVCASASCPDILTEAFVGSTLVAQVTDATRRWLLNPTKNPGPLNGAVTLSMIFSWFGGDFSEESGTIQNFVRTHAGWSSTQVPDNAHVHFAAYTWNLNAVNASGRPIAGTPPSTIVSMLVSICAMASIIVAATDIM
jgi:hypothetical protein